MLIIITVPYAQPLTAGTNLCILTGSDSESAATSSSSPPTILPRLSTLLGPWSDVHTSLLPSLPTEKGWNDGGGSLALKNIKDWSPQGYLWNFLDSELRGMCYWSESEGCLSILSWHPARVPPLPKECPAPAPVERLANLDAEPHRARVSPGHGPRSPGSSPALPGLAGQAPGSPLLSRASCMFAVQKHWAK